MSLFSRKAVVIGWIGVKTVYIGMSKKKAIKRYCEQEGIEENEFEDQGVPVKIVDLKNEFGAYDIWEK